MSGSLDLQSISHRINEEYKTIVFVDFKKQSTTVQSRLRSTLHNSGPFGNQILSLSQSILKYEDPIAQEKALQVIDLEKIYKGVDQHTAEQDAKLAKKEKLDVVLGYVDFIVLEVLKWYKNDFFKWTDKPACSPQQGEVQLIGQAKPTPEEARFQAGIVEVYRCQDGSLIRFPRYNDPVKLLETKNGRCGEWNNCFCLILRALGVRLRSIWNAEDHVWTEFFSESQKRWIHLDSCEEAFDNPTLYNKGWGKKMSYVLAFGIDGASDVSKRYVVESDKSLPRNKITEFNLKELLKLITLLKRQGKSTDEIYRLTIEDNAEKRELFGGILPNSTTDTLLLPRQSGSAEWTQNRGEAGK